MILQALQLFLLQLLIRISKLKTVVTKLLQRLLVKALQRRHSKRESLRLPLTEADSSSTEELRN